MSRRVNILTEVIFLTTGRGNARAESCCFANKVENEQHAKSISYMSENSTLNTLSERNYQKHNSTDHYCHLRSQQNWLNYSGSNMTYHTGSNICSAREQSLQCPLNTDRCTTYKRSPIISMRAEVTVTEQEVAR